MKKAMKCLVAAMVLSLLASSALMAGDWAPIYEGVEYQVATKTSPRPMKAYALRIDLKNPSVSFLATPSNGSAPYETNLQTTPAFRSAYGLEAAINANFFTWHTPYADNRGALVSNGTLVSSHEAAFPAQLRISSSKVAQIVAASGNPSGMHTVVSGDAYHLVGGVCLGANDVARARTSVGLSQDKRFLIMCVVDEGQPDSKGATILDMSYWMKDFGAWDAMNLDGGGSSCICTASGGVLNHPSDGSPRAVGANLGVNTTAYDPRMDVVIRDPNGNISKRYWTASGGWRNWTSYGQPACGSASDPSIVARGPQRLDMFVRGTDGQVYWKNYYGGNWYDWRSIGGNIVGSPDACAWNVDRIDVFARSSTSSLLHASWNGSTWSSWQDLGGEITSDPTAVSWGDGRMDIFARGANGHLLHKWAIEGQGYFPNGYWEDLGGSLNGGPDACSTQYGTIHIFYRNTNNNIIWRSYTTSSGWSGETNLSGTHYSDPGVVSRGPGYLEVFTQKAGSITTHNYYTSGGGWSGWQDFGGPVIGGPDACSWSNDSGKH